MGSQVSSELHSGLKDERNSTGHLTGRVSYKRLILWNSEFRVQPGLSVSVIREERLSPEGTSHLLHPREALHCPGAVCPEKQLSVWCWKRHQWEQKRELWLHGMCSMSHLFGLFNISNLQGLQMSKKKSKKKSKKRIKPSF